MATIPIIRKQRRRTRAYDVADDGTQAAVEVAATMAEWGSITGTLADQTDLKSALDGKADVIHTHVAADISDSTAAGRDMLTAANAAAQTALLDVFTSLLDGLAPASGGGTTNFLRADGTWAAVAGAGVSDGDKGDITVSSSGATWTIDNGVVSLAKLADMATDSVYYRKTAGTGAPEVQSLATLKTDLGLTGTNSGDQTSIVGIIGTKAQFDTAATDGDFMWTGDAPTAHTHPASEVTDFAEAVDDRVAALLVEGTNVTLTYDDGAGTLTVDAAGASPALAWVI